MSLIDSCPSFVQKIEGNVDELSAVIFVFTCVMQVCVFFVRRVKMKFDVKTLCSVGALLLCSENTLARSEPVAIITDKNWKKSTVSLFELKQKSEEELSSIIKMRTKGKISSRKDLLSVLEHMDNLTDLDFSDAGLKEFPFEILKNKKLKSLNLSGNGISNIPAGVSNLENLQRMNVERNYLRNQFETTSIIGILGDLKNLLFVNLGYYSNSIYNFLDPVIDPGAMAPFRMGKILGYHVPKDKRMDLSEKGLSRVPVDILNIKRHVKVLDLSNNNIRKLPLCLINMDKLEEIILCENPHFDSFDKIPDELLKEGWTFTLSINNERVNRTAGEIKEERIDKIQAQIKALQERLSNL